MNEIALSAIGVDQPGIVAAITGVLADIGCSLEDSDMAILRGHFAIMLVLSAPDEVSSHQLEERLAQVAEQFGMLISARALTGRGQQKGDSNQVANVPPSSIKDAGQAPFALRQEWSVCVYGADRIGIVHGITSALAEMGANITSLRTHLGRMDDGSHNNPNVTLNSALYAMVIDVLLDQRTDPKALEERLESAALQLGVAVVLNPIEEDLF
ncbi:MAG TPA: ACT domain-containing protein [Acidimicrobiales bacterium]|nr:ACT domain-containing protein [Acidimicrobiales bacterium]